MRSASNSSRTMISSTRASPIGTTCSAPAGSAPGPRWPSSTSPIEGGETFFPSAGIKVTPRAGNLLIWNNMDADGHPNPASLHQGMPVLAGTKYVITKWYRERPWSYAPVTTY